MLMDIYLKRALKTCINMLETNGLIPQILCIQYVSFKALIFKFHHHWSDTPQYMQRIEQLRGIWYESIPIQS